MGGDSLLAVRVCVAVSNRLGIQIEPEILYRGPTVESLAELLRTNNLKPTRLLLEHNTTGHRTPIFFTQIGNAWTKLNEYFNYEHPIYGIKPFYGEAELPEDATIESIAASYVEEIKDVQPEGPYLIAGLSLGSIVAFEIAQQLRQRGDLVRHLFLLDPSVQAGVHHGRTEFERYCDAASKYWHDHFAKKAFKLERKLKRLYSQYVKGEEPPKAQPKLKLVGERTDKNTLFMQVADQYITREYHGEAMLIFTARYRRRPWLKFFTGRTRVLKFHNEHFHLTKPGRSYNKWIRLYAAEIKKLEKEGL